MCGGLSHYHRALETVSSMNRRRDRPAGNHPGSAPSEDSTMITKYDAKTKTVTISFSYDPAAKYPASKSGKTSLVGTTGGNVVVSGTNGLLKVGVNAFIPKQD
jgi:hypothetical protein